MDSVQSQTKLEYIRNKFRKEINDLTRDLMVDIDKTGQLQNTLITEKVVSAMDPGISRLTGI
jgi:hypothetical protein